VDDLHNRPEDAELGIPLPEWLGAVARFRLADEQRQSGRKGVRRISTFKPSKPLGSKAYGSIPHLPGSRTGPADHTIEHGQADILTCSPRKGDRIIVTEKLDGACMSVANVDGSIIALTRSGYRAADGTWEHLRAFDRYVAKRRSQFANLLKPGERVCGEWLSLAHGTRYNEHDVLFEPFVAFDLIRGDDRILYDEFVDRVEAASITTAANIYDGDAGCTIEEAIWLLEYGGYHGAIDPPEGAVWRVEREGRVDFLAKYVRPQKIDGVYLPEVSGRAPIWNWREAA
jgi:hypothetical protein